MESQSNGSLGHRQDAVIYQAVDGRAQQQVYKQQLHDPVGNADIGKRAHALVGDDRRGIRDGDEAENEHYHSCLINPLCRFKAVGRYIEPVVDKKNAKHFGNHEYDGRNGYEAYQQKTESTAVCSVVFLAEMKGQIALSGGGHRCGEKTQRQHHTGNYGIYAVVNRPENLKRYPDGIEVN